MRVRTKLNDRDIVLMHFLSKEQLMKVLQCVEGHATPFLVVDKWMEVIGSPPQPC